MWKIWKICNATISFNFECIILIQLQETRHCKRYPLLPWYDLSSSATTATTSLPYNHHRPRYRYHRPHHHYHHHHYHRVAVAAHQDHSDDCGRWSAMSAATRVRSLVRTRVNAPGCPSTSSAHKAAPLGERVSFAYGEDISLPRVTGQTL